MCIITGLGIDGFSLFDPDFQKTKYLKLYNKTNIIT